MEREIEGRKKQSETESEREEGGGGEGAIRLREYERNGWTKRWHGGSAGVAHLQSLTLTSA